MVLTVICNLRRKEQGTKSIKNIQKKKEIIENRKKKMGKWLHFVAENIPAVQAQTVIMFIFLFLFSFISFISVLFCLFMLSSSSLSACYFCWFLIVWFRWLPFQIDLFKSPIVGCLLLRGVLKGLLSSVDLK